MRSYYSVVYSIASLSIRRQKLGRISKAANFLAQIVAEVNPMPHSCDLLMVLRKLNSDKNDHRTSRGIKDGAGSLT
jgi:hypothetical protein